jgi:hypothetical protein
MPPEFTPAGVSRGKSLIFPQKQKKRRQSADNGLEEIRQNMGKPRIKLGQYLKLGFTTVRWK